MHTLDFKPASLQTLKQYSFSRFKSDLIAGIVVGIVALPLAIAFAIASGVNPSVGLITAIIGGFLVSALGGNTVQIGGPTGAFIVIVYNIIANYGLSGLAIATFMAGCLLVIMGLFKLGPVSKFIPYPIVVGFTAGIALTIFSTQMPDFFGLEINEKLPGDFISKWGVYFRHFSTIDLTTTIIGLVSIGLIIGAPRISPRLPGALLAIVIMTAAVWVLSQFGYCTEVETIGMRFRDLTTDIPHHHSIGLNMESINLLLPSAFTIAVLGA
ncbi:MAG: sodium-independent anion transporter, partial [Muribaculaceae bacterium]|nr:sodium-independent anion transporter [Muribaculaceae bacterium]